MGTPRLSEPVDQMRNVQRTASRGDAIATDGAMDTDCRSKETNPGAMTANAEVDVAFNSEPTGPFANS